MFPSTGLDKNRSWNNLFDSYPVLLTHVETVVALKRE
jgi:lantibiotic modifying enzyme